MYSYQLTDTSSGHKTLLCQCDGQTIRLHSAYDPVKEAKRQVSSFDPGRATHVIICGLGLGYHLEAMRERFPGVELVVVEHDSEVIELARGTSPQILKGSVIIRNISQVQHVLEHVEMSSFRGARVYRHRSSYQLYPDFYEVVASDIQQYFSSRISDLLTRFEFEKMWIRNIFKNMHNLEKGYPVQGLYGKFNSIPGIIISAGPSLRRNIHYLRKLKDRALLVCVDTALKPLLKTGITPHLVMTLDAQVHSIKHFLGTSLQDVFLLADVVSYPPLVRGHEGPALFSTTAKYYNAPDGSLKREATPVMDWVEQYIPAPGDIQSGGSIATSAFDLMRNLGCDPVILMGQDLAYTGREIHCTGTHHNDEWLPSINRVKNLDTINQAVVRRRKIKYVPSFGGHDPVLTDFVLDLYRQWFADSAGKVPITVINATGGGARIENTLERSMEELVSTLPELQRTPGHLLENFIASTKTIDTARVFTGMSRLAETITHLRGLASAILNEKEAQRMDELEEVLATDDMNIILKPFLRKTLFYFNRHQDITNQKRRDMLCADIIDAADTLLPLLS